MKRQLDLFGGAEAVETPKRSRVGPADVPEDLERLAEKLPATIRPGTSSWSFPGWQGLVYDRQATTTVLARHGLAAYARHPLLRSVGIDRTFYAPISAEDFAAYAEAVPDDFRFMVKAAGQCTTPTFRDASGRSTPNELFLDPAFATAEVVTPFVEGLGEKGAALLFQFPPLGAKWAKDPERFAGKLEAFLRALPEGPSYHVEIRDRHLFGDEYLGALESAGASHCLNLHPRMPAADVQHARAAGRGSGPLVIRWMLHSGLGYEAARDRYAPFSKIVDEDLVSRSAVADICIEQARDGREVLIIANNKAEGSAPHSVFRVAEAVVAGLEGGGE